MNKGDEFNPQRQLYRQQRFALIPGCISNAVIQECLTLISDPSSIGWQNGDDSPHSWKELSGSSLVDLSSILTSDALEDILGRKVCSSFQWLNVYSGDQFIPGHHDAGGDAHLLACILVPAPREGGQFWLEREAQIIPLGAGDALLFEAKNLLHGTTPVIPAGGATRVMLSTRLWLVD